MNTNIIMITGNLVRDIEVKETANGKTVGNFTVANNTGFGDNKKTYFFRCNMWGDRVAKLAEYMSKGKKVLVTGEMQLREYEKDGEKKLSPEIFVRDVELLGGSKGESSDAPADNGSDNIPF